MDGFATSFVVIKHLALITVLVVIIPIITQKMRKARMLLQFLSHVKSKEFFATILFDGLTWASESHIQGPPPLVVARRSEEHRVGVGEQREEQVEEGDEQLKVRLHQV
ncbi:hypothetical protein V2J09_018187 [Rumex salicifolius]